MAPVPADWQKAAVAITPGFEVQGDPYQGATGDFDKMGISCGALQWNIGQGSLQPLVKDIGEARVKALMPRHGVQMWEACNTTISKGLVIVRGWQTGTKLDAKPREELRALMGSTEGRQAQNTRIDKVANTANNQAAAWHTAGGRAPDKRMFCWFFDLVTQNGGLEGLTPADVKAFITLNTPEKADDFVCDWLAAVTGTKSHQRDAKRNGAGWRGASDGKLELLVMSFLRSKTANPTWRHVVINRKGTIAMGGGWVNSTKYDLASHGL